MAIRVVTEHFDTARAVFNLRRSLKPSHLSRITAIVGVKVFDDVRRNTPKLYTGNTRQSWKIVTLPETGNTLVQNENKVMRFLEYGTKGATARAGRLLFIPLNKKGFWRRGKLKFGRDFVLAHRVRGITARHIARKSAEKSRKWLKDEILHYIQTRI